MTNWFELEKEKYEGKFHPDVERLINSGHVNMMAAMHLIRLPVDEQHALIVEAITQDKQTLEKTLATWLKRPEAERRTFSRRFFLILADNLPFEEIERRGISTEDLDCAINFVAANKGPESRIRLLRDLYRRLRGDTEDGFDLVGEISQPGYNTIECARLTMMATPGQLMMACQRIEETLKAAEDFSSEFHSVAFDDLKSRLSYLRARYEQICRIFHNVPADADPPLGTIRLEGKWVRPSAFQMQHEDVGRLVHGTFLCNSCAMAHDLAYPSAIAVYPINIMPYSQVCEQCGEMVVSGYRRADGSGNPLSVFDKSWEIEKDDVLEYLNDGH